mmetsp:Transcript_14053/g.52680  ORF Transcript_14053/g.52680 Transcript_14053/m.52680 type:complete len:325 (+) Transcript_14053:3064-4038(+)
MCVPRRRQPRRRQNREARDAFTGFQLSAFLIRVSASFFCRGFNRQKRCFVFFVTPRRFIPPVDRVVRRHPRGSSGKRVVHGLVFFARFRSCHRLRGGSRQVRVVNRVVLLVDFSHNRLGASFIKLHRKSLNNLRVLGGKLRHGVVVPLRLGALNQTPQHLLLVRQVVRHPPFLLVFHPEHGVHVLGGVPVVLRGGDVGDGGVDVFQSQRLLVRFPRRGLPFRKFPPAGFAVAQFGQTKRALVIPKLQQQPERRGGAISLSGGDDFVRLQDVLAVLFTHDVHDLGDPVPVIPRLVVDADTHPHHTPRYVRFQKRLCDPLLHRGPL